jgi:hypothetical protein
MHELLATTYNCAYCGEENETLVDPTGGPEQSYTEDCEICCRPNLLKIRISPEGDVTLDVQFDE